MIPLHAAGWKGSPLATMPVQNAVPHILCGFGKPEQVTVFDIDDTFVNQKLLCQPLAATSSRVPAPGGSV